MKVSITILLILVLFSLNGCRTNRTYQEQVLSDVLPQLIDSFRFSTVNLIPPPPPPIYDKDSILIGLDSIAFEQFSKRRNELISKMDSVDSRLLIGLADSCYAIDLSDLRRRGFSDSLTLRRVISDNAELKISNDKWDLDKINIPEDYQLSYKSDIEEKYSEVWSIDDRKFGGLIGVSKIYFDKDGENGFLEFAISAFRYEGSSYFVIIEKINGEWKVKRIVLNWIT